MSLYSVVYFEQQRGLFCGAHAINATLQGPWIKPKALTKIAKRMNDFEAPPSGSERPTRGSSLSCPFSRHGERPLCVEPLGRPP